MGRRIALCLFVLFFAPLFADEEGCSPPCQNECDPPCCLTYTPWERGSDPGLYCLPGSRCSYPYCSKPSGAELYRPLSNFSHVRRHPSEYGPQEWHTIMLQKRYTIPLPGSVYRKITRWLMGVETLKGGGEAMGEKIPDYIDQLSSQADSSSKAGEELALENTSGEDGLAFQEIITFDGDDTLPFFTHPVINTLFCGVITTNYQTDLLTSTGYNGNDSFSTLIVPYWLARYGDSFLAIFKLTAQIVDLATSVTLAQAQFSYFYNDSSTFTFGLFTLPFGAFYTWWFPSWINKLINVPIIRQRSPNWAFLASTIGVDVRGGVPLCGLIPGLPSAFFSYDFWVGNGVSEATFAPIANGLANAVPDNNNSKAFGGRFAFWPNYCAEIAFSAMGSQWNNNQGSSPFIGQRLYYSALAVDWNIHLGDYAIFRGEWLWSRYQNGLGSFNRAHGYWAELSSMLFGIVGRMAPAFYCRTHSFWDSSEFLMRLERFRVNFAKDSRDRFALGFNYYFTQSSLFKFEYDFNYNGAPSFNHNQVNVSLVYSW